MAAKKGIPSWSDITSGYRLSLVSGAASCLATLLVNVGVTIWAGTLVDLDHDGKGRRVLYEGSCSTSKDLNTGLHVLINLLSSVLLGASNYGIQCLSAPTRGQVDEAHAAGSYLDVGIVSVRNLKRHTGLTRVLWFTLILSSLPLHLLYNSVVFSSLTVPSRYMVLSVDERIEHTTDLDLPEGLTDSQELRLRDLLADSARPGSLDNLTVVECIDQYAVSYQTSRNDVILVHARSEDGRSIPTYLEEAFVITPGYPQIETFDWICPGLEEGETCQPRLDAMKEAADDWRPYGYRVKYCLSRPMPKQLCRVNFNLYLAVGVILSNLIKMAVIAYMVLYLAPDRLLVLGDAVQSFMARPDLGTRGSCLVTIGHVRDSYRPRDGGKPWSGARVLGPERKRRITPVGKSRVTWGVVLYGIALVISLTLLIWGISSMHLPANFTSMTSLGFGQPDGHTLISWGAGNWDYNIASMATVANLPQIVLSFIYFQWNAIFTSMAMGKEWNDYGRGRASLRVSDRPRGTQRSRYFLELPYRFSLPLMGTSALLHWILSQCIFVVAVESINMSDPLQEGSISWQSITCGYSPLATFIVVLVSLVVPISVLLEGWRRLPGHMPVAGSCSLAIAAACHHPDGRGHPDDALDALQWGVMVDWKREQQQQQRQHPGMEEREQEREQEGQGLLQPTSAHDHCGFSNDAVEEPQVGHTYA